MRILTIENKKDAAFLRQKTAKADIASLKREEIKTLIKEMRETMKAADGIGLSANQVGVNMQFFVAELPTQSGKRNKFYAVFNPEIIKFSEEKTNMEEGCLSIPETFGNVERPEKVALTGVDPNGRKIKIKAWGLLARVFQHETDHLNGFVFIDRTKDFHKLPESERLKRKQKTK